MASSKKTKENTSDEAYKRLVNEMIKESLSGPYVHEECGDTMWEDALAQHAAKLKGKEEEQ